jgi:hypothetical protein
MVNGENQRAKTGDTNVKSDIEFRLAKALRAIPSARAAGGVI